jgi:malonyl-CoA O-methyltransferase
MTVPSKPDADAVPQMDAGAAQRWRQQIPAESPWLHEEIGARMAERLGWIRQHPQAWVSWSPLLGGLQAHAQVAARYPEAGVRLAGENAALAQARLQGPIGEARGVAAWLQGLWGKRKPGAVAEDSVPQDGHADLVWANMALHWHAQPKAVLQRWGRWLRPDGFLMFSCLGPETLIELRRVLAQAGWPVPMHPLTDMHDWGDMMVEVGFAEPVMDMERLTLAYASAERLLADLRAWGRNCHSERFAGLRGRGYRRELLSLLEKGLPRNADGQMTVTVEVVYGHAYKPQPRVKLAPSSEVSLDDMRTLLRRSSQDPGRR